MRISTITLFIIIGLVVLAIFMTPSANFGLIFSNESDKLLFLSMTNMKSHKVKIVKIDPNQDTYVEFVSGEDTEKMWKTEFYIFVYDSKANIILNRKFTGNEVIERKVMKLDNADNLEKVK